MKRIIFLFFLAFCSVVSAKTYYVAPAPTGDDNIGDGSTGKPWATWNKAIAMAYAGDTVFFMGGVYYPPNHPTIMPPEYGRDGTASNPICFFNYPGEVPIFDFSKLGAKYAGLNIGIEMTGVDYWHLKGLKFINILQVTYDKLAWGVYINGCGNLIFENCTVGNVNGHGYFTVNNTATMSFINCDVYDCYDSQSPTPGNWSTGFDYVVNNIVTYPLYYYGCRAWHCAGDGFSGHYEGPVYFDRCWSWNHGYLSKGEGSGFKPGPIDKDIPFSYQITNCIAAYNYTGSGAGGFYENNDGRARSNLFVYNNIAYKCGVGFQGLNPIYFLDNQNVYRNNISYACTNLNKYFGSTPPGYVGDHNSWDHSPAVTVTDADFISLPTTLAIANTVLGAARQADGSLPDLGGYFHLASTSDLRDAGVDIGLDYDADSVAFNNPTPSLGPYEYVEPGSAFDPSVVITSPSGGSTFTAPASISIIANASDADGTISKVEFFAGATKLGEKTSNPWSFTWNNVPAGTYSLTAVATDNSGAKTTSSAVSITVAGSTPPVTNQPPVITISNPVSGSTFTAPASIAITANASDTDGTVSKVEFFNGAAKIGEKTSNPWSFAWNNVPLGTYSLTAVATDNSNAKTTSPVVSIIVNNLPPVTNQPPVVTISNPAKGRKYKKPAQITIDAVASDPDGTISKVEFFNGNNKLGEMTTAPWSFTWKDVDVGTYSLTAVATDNLNAATTSSPVDVEVEDVITSFYDANSEIINLYPNPNNGIFTIELIDPEQSEKSEIIITSFEGKVIYNGTMLQEELTKQFDLSDIKPGFYILILSRNEIIVTKKFIKE